MVRPSTRMRAFHAALQEMLKDELPERAFARFAYDGPELARLASRDVTFLDGIDREPPGVTYSRTKVIGEQPTILLMRWHAGFELGPHSHWAEPCFDLVLDGELEITNYAEREIAPDVYALTPLGMQRVKAGECSVVDNEHVRVHSVNVREDTCSLHVYPNTHKDTHRFMPRNDGLFDRFLKSLSER